MRFARLPAHSSGRGEINDPPATLSHTLERRLVGQKGAAGVYRKHVFPLIQGDFISSGVGRYSGSIDHHVHPPPQLTNGEVNGFGSPPGTGACPAPAFSPPAFATSPWL